MSEERRQGFDVLKKSLDLVQDDVVKAGETARLNREQIEQVQKAISAHDQRTALTGIKVDSVVTAVGRIEDKLDGVKVEVTETRVRGEDTRTGLIKARSQIDLMHELVLRHDEKMNQSLGDRIGLSDRTFKIIALATAGVFLMFIVSPQAAEATIAALKGLFSTP